MARTVRNAKIDTPSARAKLKQRREPYWVVINQGRALGYRKGKKGGTWIARYREEDGRQKTHSLGPADDGNDAGGAILDYQTAQQAARQWFTLRNAGIDIDHTGPYTVKDACTEYLSWFKKQKKSYEATKRVVDVSILPTLGDIEIGKLRRKRIEDWHQTIADTPARLRTKRGTAKHNYKPLDDEEARRRRKSTANRHLTVLKAALNRAYNDPDNGHVLSDNAWKPVKPFTAVDAARIRYLTEDESTRLINASAEPFKSLLIAGLLTGARHGELSSAKVQDFDADAGTLHIPTSKSGKARHIALTDEGISFFERASMGKHAKDHLFTNSAGSTWKKSEERRYLHAACEAIKIEPIGFHVLRHTYASRLVMRGAPMKVVADQLGHADVRMVDKHYGHLDKSYIKDTVNSAFGELGLETDNVARLIKS